jgi:formate dehydrogenase iron-sulfur subunit
MNEVGRHATMSESDELAAVRQVLQERAEEPGALLPILHDVQDALGYIPPHTVTTIAEGVNLSRAEVHGVITYYHHFRSAPAARHVIQICRAEACQSMGADALLAARRAAPGLQRARRHLEERHVHAGAGLLPRPVRLVARDDDQRRTARTHDHAFVRCAGGAVRRLRMSITIYVPRDSAALAVGAERVAERIAQEAAIRGVSFGMVRNGSRGLFWLEPMVEVQPPPRAASPTGRWTRRRGRLLTRVFPVGGSARAAAGPHRRDSVSEKQERLTFARMGVTDPLSLADYQAHEGYAGLRRALALQATEVVQQVLDAGLRGRGGAAFPAGIKWKTVAALQATQKYVVCNADEATRAPTPTA